METQACGCGCANKFLRRKGGQIGLYCASCERWFKWVGKKDVDKLTREGYVVHEEAYIPMSVEVAAAAQRTPKQSGAVGVAAPPLSPAASARPAQAVGVKRRVLQISEDCPLCCKGERLAVEGSLVGAELELQENTLYYTDDTGFIAEIPGTRFCPICGNPLDGDDPF